MSFDPRCLDARALDFHWRATDDLASAAGLTELGRSSYRRARNSVLASLVLAGDSDRPWVSYSRSRDFYAAEGRYEGTDYSYSNVRLAVAEIAEAGLIEEMRSKPGSHLTHGHQSRMIATDLLMSLAEGVDLSYVGTRCPLVLKDEDGTRINYRETALTRRLVAEVEDINSYLGGIEVGISPKANPEDWRRSAHHLHARKVKRNGETWTCVRPTPTPAVYRVYGRGRWDRHGRWYGWWQSLPKSRRAELLINGELAIEPDFSAIHPRLLYAMRGHVLQHDPYVTKAWHRDAGKLALNVVLNAKTIPKGIGALLEKRYEMDEDGEPVWVYGPAETRRIVEAVQAANPLIADDIGSDAGIKLMNIDSGMAHEVMKRCRAAQIGVLPVHDSFIAPGSKGVAVTAIMGDVMAQTISTFSPVFLRSSDQTIRYTPLGVVPGVVGVLPSLGETSPAEPEIAPSPEGQGNTLSVLETPFAEPVSCPAAGVTAPLPEGKESRLPKASGFAPSLLATPSPEAPFRPVVQVRVAPPRRPSLRPVVLATPSPTPLAPPAPVPDVPPSSAPTPFPAFLQVALRQVRAEAKAAADAAALLRESPPPPAPVGSSWARPPSRVDSPAPVRQEAVAPVPALRPARPPQARVEAIPASLSSTNGPSAPVPAPTKAWSTMSREERIANVGALADRVRALSDERKRMLARQAFR
ncbi:hypothetical protein [Methylobacterium flocculans]|uniref:hypothetical protein n=1 Tax=Methylobacterium flocculans TaxID=2984843 RepID=UPI0021F26BE1|nr:hypothetical protein [Methylobacterium sp. FF17]